MRSIVHQSLNFQSCHVDSVSVRSNFTITMKALIAVKGSYIDKLMFRDPFALCEKIYDRFLHNRNPGEKLLFHALYGLFCLRILIDFIFHIYYIFPFRMCSRSFRGQRCDFYEWSNFKFALDNSIFSFFFLQKHRLPRVQRYACVTNSFPRGPSIGKGSSGNPTNNIRYDQFCRFAQLPCRL
jgi:hypothetical protein